MKDFDEIMKKRTDAELIEITTILKDDYQPEAILAAERELTVRNLSTENIEAAKDEIQSKKQNETKIANEPLELHWKILCLFFPGLINFIIAFIFKGQGQDRKFKDAWKWTFLGFGFYISLIIIAAIIFS